MCRERWPTMNIQKWPVWYAEVSRQTSADVANQEYAYVTNLACALCSY